MEQRTGRIIGGHIEAGIWWGSGIPSQGGSLVERNSGTYTAQERLRCHYCPEPSMMLVSTRISNN